MEGGKLEIVGISKYELVEIAYCIVTEALVTEAGNQEKQEETESVVRMRVKLWLLDGCQGCLYSMSAERSHAAPLSLRLMLPASRRLILSTTTAATGIYSALPSFLRPPAFTPPPAPLSYPSPTSFKLVPMS